MKKKALLLIAMVAVLVCALAISVSAARVEDYEDTFTLNNTTVITHYEKWFYNEGKNYVRKAYSDTVL